MSFHLKYSQRRYSLLESKLSLSSKHTLYLAVSRSTVTPWKPTAFKQNADTHCESRQSCGKYDVQPEAIDQSEVSRDMRGRSILVNLYQIRAEDRLLLLRSLLGILLKT